MPAIVLLLSLAVPAAACLNYYGKNLKGDVVETDSERADPTKLLRELTLHPEHDDIKKLDLGPEPDPRADFKVRNDYAASLVRQGKAKRAIEILESIEQFHPGEYMVASNLGTAYELNGDVARAHHWIAEGMKRYPDVHQQTEWLHLRILEVKRELAKDPNWLQTRSVLDFDFGNEVVPKLPPVWGKMGEERVLQALRYQLHERLAFVSPPEPIVGELIGVYADYAALKWPVEYVIPLYDLALSFKPTRSELLEKRRERAMELRPPPSPIPEIQAVGDWGVIAVVLLGITLATLVAHRKLRGQPAPRS
ncbi:MAG TPA: hypothetical protein VM222_03880 [Planctomycetota bacterium]|nr:hypothetical protein [Planctomycetota bacterium]